MMDLWGQDWKFYVVEDPKWLGFSIDKDGKVEKYGPGWDFVEKTDEFGKCPCRPK
jgi:hypothetical protein